MSRRLREKRGKSCEQVSRGRDQRRRVRPSSRAGERHRHGRHRHGSRDRTDTQRTPREDDRRPTLRAASNGHAAVGPPTLGAEDFSYFQQKIPGLYFFLGVVPKGQDPQKAAKNHSPHFFADEGALPVGVRAMTQLTLDYLSGARPITP